MVSNTAPEEGATCCDLGLISSLEFLLWWAGLLLLPLSHLEIHLSPARNGFVGGNGKWPMLLSRWHKGRHEPMKMGAKTGFGAYKKGHVLGKWQQLVIHPTSLLVFFLCQGINKVFCPKEGRKY